MTDAEPLIDLSAPRHYEQVTPRGRRRRRAAIVLVAAAALVVTGGAGYAVVQRAASPEIVPAVAPAAQPSGSAGAPVAPGGRPSPGLDPIRASPAD
ncbi:hypothetical protein [Actinoplanes sp. NPDC026619]|uniref:hypothetical protein n=1 Tax=Actinoplanes sp. NPDC026619 TaxID=3155798 RepID=UPI0033F12A8C